MNGLADGHARRPALAMRRIPPVCVPGNHVGLPDGSSAAESCGFRGEVEMTQRTLFRLALGVFACCLMPAGADAQLFFEADAVFLDRDNNGGAPFINGPEAISNNPGSFNAEAGYRLRLGGYFSEYQVDAIFTQVNPWTNNASGTFARAVTFDDSASNPFVVPVTPANQLAGISALRTAAMSTNGAADESLEGEYLLPGAQFRTQNRSDYRDFQLDFGTSYLCRRWRMGVGYRYIRINETSTMFLQGIFDARDVDDGDYPGDLNNDTNDGLSHAALTNSGLALIGGAADGFDGLQPNALPAIPPDIIAYETYGRADNELNGAQFTFGYLVVNGEWITLETFSNVGIYRNNIRGSVRETVAGLGNDNSIYQRTLTDDRLKPAFAGTLGFKGTVALTDYINLVGGYEALFLSGIALGPDQILGVGTSNMGTTSFRAQTDGNIILHGGNVGFEILW